MSARYAPPSAEISGPRVVAQVRYRDTTAALATAAALTARKCRNSAALLNKFRRYQRRYPERAARVDQNLRVLERTALQLERSAAPTERRILFLREAQATRAYWSGVATLVALHDPRWTRRHPHAHDPLNVLLNVGYTVLARWVRDAIRTAGLLPEIGVFHATRPGHEPLVYDLMELFRQPVIDAVALPLLTKKKRPVSRLFERDLRRAVAKFHEQWEQPFRYRKQCLPLRAIAEKECVALVRAMERGIPWEPYRHPWGHGWTCVGYRVHAHVKKRLRDEAA